MEMIQISKAEYEELLQKAEELEVVKGLVASLLGRIGELEKKITELEAKATKNSKNSNKPPSSDGPRKGKIKNSRVKSDKKSGGQVGHDGTTKALVPNPSLIIELKPKTECECGGKVKLESERYSVRQVTDLQPVKVVTIEYRSQEGICDICGKLHKATFPESVEGVSSYGENLKAIVTYLTVYQLIPLKRATELIEDIFGIKMSQGTIVSSEKEAYEKLEETENLIKNEIINSVVAHFDESGMRVCGKSYWLHGAGTETSTVYGIDQKRGYEAMDKIGILPLFQGTAIHDHWKSYYHYTCAHGECNEHHLRHLKYLHEDLGYTWSAEMACLLIRIKKHVEINMLFGSSKLELSDIQDYEKMYREILLKGSDEVEKIPIESKRMINRLTKYEQETLLFMYDFAVPFTNNLAERDVRMPKAKQKISGGFRTEEGANGFARVRGFVSTIKKRGKNILEGLKATFKNESTKFLYTESEKS